MADQKKRITTLFHSLHHDSLSDGQVESDTIKGNVTGYAKSVPPTPHDPAVVAP